MYRILPVLAKTVMIVFDLRAIDLMKIWRGATTHHSLLSLYSLQSLPLQAWQLCNMITPDVRILNLFLSNISGKHFPHFNVTATACPWEYKMVVREGGTSPTKAFLRRSETSEHTCKNPEHICKKTEHTCKKQTHLQKKMLHIRCFPEITEKTPKLERMQMNSQRSFAGHIWIVSQVTNDPHACRCRGDNTWMGEGMGK